MAISTVDQVKTRFLALLDDPAGAIFSDAVYTEAFGEAREALNSGFLRMQIPLIEKIVTYTLPANTTALSPATALITDFGELVELEERRAGSSDDYVRIWEVDKLSQRTATDALGEFVWRLDQFQFIGATVAREVRIRYWDTGVVPASGSVVVDGAKTFLAKYAAGVAGPRKGHEYAEKYFAQAVGQYYPERIGGELFALLQPMVRSRQRVQVAPPPYSVIRRIHWRRPQQINVAAGCGSGGDMPLFFRSSDGTITGDIDGVNDTFYLAAPCAEVEVYLNGVKLTKNVGYSHGTNVVTFLAGYVPVVGSYIDVTGYNS